MAVLSGLSAKERNVWVELFANLVAVSYYWVSVSKIPDFFQSASPAMVWIIVKTIGLTIVLSIIFTIAVTMLSRSSDDGNKADERDLQIASNGNSIAYYMLTLCVVLIIGHVVLNALAIEANPSYASKAWLISPVVIIHLLFAALIISSVTKSLVQLFRYRRGY